MVARCGMLQELQSQLDSAKRSLEASHHCNASAVPCSTLSMPESWRQDSLASGDEALKASEWEGEDRDSEPQNASEAALLEKSQLSERLKAAEDEMVGTLGEMGSSHALCSGPTVGARQIIRGHSPGSRQCRQLGLAESRQGPLAITWCKLRPLFLRSCSPVATTCRTLST